MFLQMRINESGDIMNKKQKVCISLLSVHSFLLLVAFVNIFVNIFEYFTFKPYSFSYSYEFFFLPLYRFIYEQNVADLFFLFAFIGFSMFLTIMEYKAIINYTRLPNALYPIANGFWITICSVLSLSSLVLSNSELHYIYIGTNVIYTNIILMLVGMCALTVVVVIMTGDIIENRTEEEFEKSKYLTLKKTYLFIISPFVTVVCIKYFASFVNREILVGYIDALKYTMYGFGIYIALGSILQSVKRIRKLKRANYLGSEEKIAVFESDRNKKIIALAVFILSYFVFYLF